MPMPLVMGTHYVPWLAVVSLAIGTAVAASEVHEVASALRRLQVQNLPWRVLEGEGCEVVEDGCIQTVGYPGNYTNSSCQVLSKRIAYILDPISFDIGNDTLIINGVEYSGTLVKKTPVNGPMLWNPTSSNSGWKICPRSSCLTMVCPPGYATKAGSENIACSGLACNASIDLDTCCNPKCAVPANFTSQGYALNANDGVCPYSDYPYYLYYSEAACSVTCATQGELFASGLQANASFCPSPGEFLLPEPCVASGDPLIRWQWNGGCSDFSPDCLQSKGFPYPYDARPCGAWLDGEYEITFTAFDLEDGFDMLTVAYFEGDTVFTATGREAPEPFILRTGMNLLFEPDASIEGTGFRVCARPLCSMVACPYGYIFMCEALDTACTDIDCEDRNTTCCRESTAAELAAMSGSSNAVSEGCLPNTTTTTTTTTAEGRQLIGVATFEVNGSTFSSISGMLLNAWQTTLAQLNQRPLEDVLVYPDGDPDSTPALQAWMLGYQVQNVEADSEPLPFTLVELEGYMANASENGSMLLNGGVRIFENTASTGEGSFKVGVQPLCEDYDGWLDDWSSGCGTYATLCTPFGTSTFYRFSAVPGYYWYFYSSLPRSDPSEPDAREACCRCGGGLCTGGAFHLRGTDWDFCAPCAAGWYSSEATGVSTECAQCEPGHYSTWKAASSSCTGASVGHFACCFGVTEEAETPCAVGTFASEEGQSACADCPSGTFAAVIRSASCADCGVGRYAATDGSTSCTACPSGTFANVSGTSRCFDCPAGSTASTGQASCTRCDPGKYNTAAGSVDCASCPLGHYAVDSGTTQCEPCDAGYFADSMGTASCDICPSGQQSTATGATACESCELGNYKSEGDLLCTACAPGYYSSRLGDSECVPCELGQYVNESGASTCFECPRGRAGGTAGLAECPACLPGQYIGTAGETTCLDCTQGRIADAAAASECVDCEAGFVAAAGGLTTCTACSPGRHNPEQRGTRCEDCSLSTFAEEYGMPECAACQSGRYALLPGLSACFDCEPGRYTGVSGSSDCTQCEQGRYANMSSSTSCRECSDDLPGPPAHWTTMHSVNQTALGESRWEILFAATSASSCGCKAGTQPNGQADINYVDGGPPEDALGGRGHGCVVCGEGLECLGMGQLRIAAGYAWDSELSVYDCVHAIPDACRGGTPGTCAPGWVANTDGSCSACSGADYAVPITAMVCLVSMAVASYFFYDRKRSKNRPSLTSLLMLICMGQLLTILQQLGIISTIRVQFDSPLSDVLDFVSTIGFMDIDFLRPQCLVSMDPVRSYGFRVAAVYVALCLVILTHVLSTVVQHRGGRPLTHWYILLCALGTIIMAFFVSIITTMLGPLQCKKHPNNSRSISWYPSVLCWEDDRHTQMFVIGVSACTLPLIFLSAASWAAYVFPSELKKGASNFLTGWAFLFFRYHTDAYWYGPVQLIRNALISAAPVLPTASMQTLFLESVMLASVFVVARAMPWRARAANYLEVVMHYVFLCLVLCACLFISDEPASEIALFATFLILLMPIAVIVLVVLGLIRKTRSRGKPFQFFLCHHKVGAGSFCRLLKMRLLKTRGVYRKVFVDTDDLQNLGTLFDMVDQDTESLVCVHSSHLLTRPWCIGEITTAYRAKINIQIVRLDLVEKPSEHFIENFAVLVPDVACLTPHGIELASVQEALGHWCSLPAVHLPLELQDKTVTSLATALVGKMSVTASHDLKAADQGEAVPERSLLIIADKTDIEGASTAFILRELLLPIITPLYEVTAHVLTHGERVPVETITKVALICTAGLFENQIITTLLQLSMSSLVIMPMICRDTFVFPTPGVLRESVVVKALVEEEQERLIAIAQSIFTEIALEFSPSALGATEAVLTARAKDLANRLWSNAQSISRRMSSTTLKTKDSGELHTTSITESSNEVSKPEGEAEKLGHGSKGDLVAGVQFEFKA